MKLKSLNWPLWLGLLVAVFAFISYTAFFVKFPITRDFPWANLALFFVAVVLLLIGLKRGFAYGRLRSKVVASIVVMIGVIAAALFVFTIFIVGRWLPASPGAPHVGARAPEFTLADTNNNLVSLSELLSTPVQGKTPKGVLLVFYRGYW